MATRSKSNLRKNTNSDQRKPNGSGKSSGRSDHELRDVAENSDLRQLLEEQLADIYYSEKKLVTALPKMARAASNDELRAAVEGHLEETRGQVEQLEGIFELLGLKAKGKTCEAMDGLMEEANELMSDFKGSEAADAAIIAGAQKIEHYEIATYGCLAAWARQLQLEEVADGFDRILEEEKEADRKLSELAEQLVNPQAE
jgi:ferritin-like metal-binding protein YciE